MLEHGHLDHRGALPLVHYDDTGRMEINLALAEIEKAFASRRTTSTRVSRSQQQSSST
jgi:metal-dependent hydrolase (beta-lactamase superfamily II)